MAEKSAKQVLVGTNAKVFLAGEEIGFWTDFSVTITPNYEDVYVGSDVDRTEVSWTGEGSISHQVTNSIGAKLFNKLKNVRGIRFEIEAEIKSDATGEVQNITIPGVTFDSLPIANWSKGGVVTGEMAFRFPASKIQFNQLIS